MTENQNPATTDDVQGHMPRRMFTDDQSQSLGQSGSAGAGRLTDDDVEGHMPHRKLTDDQPQDADDVEGHMPRHKFTDDQVEGHMPVKRGIDADAADDTEGHMPLRKFTDDEVDPTGHVVRPRGITDDTDDTEGHARRHFTDDTDDTEGHGHRRLMDDSDDTEGHAVTGGYRPTSPKADDGEDDVAGHLSGALGSQKKTEDG
jgi:hypothetical protein